MVMLLFDHPFKYKPMDQHLRSSHNPYKELYIYYLEGCFKKNSLDFKNNFIGNWEEDGFSFLFFTKSSLEKVEQMAASENQVTLIDHFHMTYDQWQGSEAKPSHIGGFLISPPWNMARNDPDLHHLLLDPGVVFGTGTHPTTMDCLEAIEIAFENYDIASAIDLGTGTGLLSLAAAGLGCPKTIAMDLNLLAVKTAAKNIALNHMEDKILAVQGDADKFIDFRSDLVISNIHYEVMIRLISSKGFLEKKLFILSGLMRSQAEKIENMLAGLPVDIIKRWHQNGIWHTFLGRIC